MRLASLLMFIWMFVIVGCQPKQSSQLNVEVEQIAAAYTNWPSPMSEPVNQSFDLWVLCRSWTEQEQAYMDSEHGKKATQLFVNEPSILPILDEMEGRTFPSGTILVKEKTSNTNWETGESVETYVAGLGIMIKDESEWTYVYWTPDGISIDKETKHCADCHSAAAQTDYVYYPQFIYPLTE